MKKKGVELSMNVIIIAAIGLLVLVILAVLVINAGGKTQTQMKSCIAVGGICQPNGCDTSKGYSPQTSGTCDTGACCTLFSTTG